MKIELEPTDIESFLYTARHWYGLDPTEEQVREIVLNKNSIRASEFVGKYLFWGMDTEVRSDFIAAVIDYILGSEQEPVADTMYEQTPDQYWHWPLNGSPDEYSEPFYKVFYEACDQKGLKTLTREMAGR